MRNQMPPQPVTAPRTARVMATVFLALGCNASVWAYQQALVQQAPATEPAALALPPLVADDAGVAAPPAAPVAAAVAPATAPDGLPAVDALPGPAPAGDSGNGTVIDVGEIAPQPGVGPAVPVQLWVYVDGQGIAHYANERLDSRYVRFSMSQLRPHDAPLHVDVLTPPPPPASAAVAVRGGKGVIPSAQAQAVAQRRIQAQHKGYQLHAKHLQAAAKRYNVDATLLRAIASAESAFNPHAVSHKGAIGLMQIMPGTAERFGVSGDATRSLEQKLKDPAINAPIAARYVRYLQTLFPGRTDLVLASYNAGEGAVKRYGNKIPPFKETQNYVQIVMTTYHTLSPQAQRAVGDSTSTMVVSNEPAYTGNVGRGTRVRMTYQGAQ